MQSAIPKFTSFRPKSVASTLVNDDPPPLGKHECPPRKSLRSNKGREIKVERRSQHITDSGSNARPRTSSWQEEDDLQVASFVLDIKGDGDNVAYGENSRSKVPNYRNLYSFPILGERNTRWQSRAATRPLTTLSRAEVATLRTEGKAIRIGGERDQHLQEDDFVLLKSKKKRGGHYHTRDHVLGVKAWEIDLHDDTHNEQTSDSGSFSEVSEHQDDAEKERVSKTENARLSSRLKSEPESVNAWLEYIDHQESWANDSQTVPSDGKLHDSGSSMTEVKLAIFSKALKAVSRTNPERPLLVLRMMAEAEKLWGLPQVAQKWEDLLREGENLPDLFLEYLNVTMRFAGDFQYERVLGVFQKCLQAIQKSQSRPTNDRMGFLEVYILLRLTSFMQETGMCELAAAVWQGVLELKFFSPQSSAHQPAGGVEGFTSFEKFWDAEQPRIGEPNATGWCNARTQADVATNEYVSTDLQANHSWNEDALARWVETELQQMEKCRLPGRTSDAQDDGDPYHTVLYADIQPWLENLRLEAPRELFLDAFLSFSRLPSLAETHDLYRWRLDPFLIRPAGCLDLATMAQVHPISSSLSQEARAQVHIEEIFSFGAPQLCRTTTETLFAPVANSCFFAARSMTDSKFTINVLKSLVHALPNYDVLAEYALALELVVAPKQARKTAKQLLKERSSCLLLYNAFGLIESRLDAEANSDRVFTTAISMSASLGSRGERGIGLLRRTWAWEALRKGNNVDALERLMSGQEIEQIALWRDSSLRSGDYNDAAIHSECLALTTYLEGGNSLAAALDVFDDEIDLLVSGSSVGSACVERLHQARAQLLAHHISSKKNYKPALIRSVLRNSIQTFPNNTVFLNLYADTERRFRIDDRMRQVFKETAGEQTVIHWTCAIRNEIRRAAYQASTAHSIRNTFEAALVSRGGRSSAMIWALYFHFTHILGDHQKSKEILYRGMREIPWVKEFGMLAFTHLQGVLSHDELLAIYSTMMDRGLRVHVELERFL